MKKEIKGVVGSYKGFEIANPLTYKDIEKEFEEKVEIIHNDLVFGDFSYTKDFLKAKINQVIDEMIGEVEELEQFSEVKSSLRECSQDGYECGVEDSSNELKEYKKKFNNAV